MKIKVKGGSSRCPGGFTFLAVASEGKRPEGRKRRGTPMIAGMLRVCRGVGGRGRARLGVQKREASKMSVIKGISSKRGKVP